MERCQKTFKYSSFIFYTLSFAFEPWSSIIIQEDGFDEVVI